MGPRWLGAEVTRGRGGSGARGVRIPMYPIFRKCHLRAQLGTLLMSYVLGNTRKISRADTIGTHAQTKWASIYTNDQ